MGKKDKNEIVIVNISHKNFDDLTIINKFANVLYNEVRMQIGSWTEPEISTDDIKNDTKIIVEIMNITNTLVLADKETQSIDPGLHNVKITIIENDKYFIIQDETIYIVKVI